MSVVAQMSQRIQVLETENEQLKSTNKKLHRRVQETESALIEWRKISELTKEQTTGRFYPALLRYALTRVEAENERLRKIVKYAESYVSAPPQVKGAVFRDLDKALLALKNRKE